MPSLRTVLAMMIAALAAAAASGRPEAAAARRQADPPRLLVRVLTAAGEPLADALVQLHWSANNAVLCSAAVTDAEGRLDLAIDEPFADGGTLHVELRRNANVTGTVLGFAALPFPKAKPGPNDRGDLRLLPEPLFASARVVDERGAPVPGLRLRCTDDQRTIEARTGDDGSVTLTGRPPAPAFASIEIGDEGWFFAANPQQPHRLEAGARMEPIVVRRAARLLVAAKDLPPELLGELEIECRGTGEPFWTRIDAAGHLRVPAGTWDLRFRLSGDDEVLHEVADVRADAGVENHDLRLLRLDWKSFLAVVTVRVLDDQGAPCDECTVWQFGTAKHRGRLAPGGVCRLLVPAAGAHLAVQYDRWPAVDLGMVKDERTVRPPAARPLRIVLSQMPTLPEGVELVAALRRVDPLLAHVTLPFDGTGIATSDTAWRGTNEVHVRVRRGSRWAAVTSPIPFDVPAGGGEHRIEIDDAMRRAIEERARAFAPR